MYVVVSSCERHASRAGSNDRQSVPESVPEDPLFPAISPGSLDDG
jgi:hypothetical protein